MNWIIWLAILQGLIVIFSGSTFQVDEPAEEGVVSLSLNWGACFKQCF